MYLFGFVLFVFSLTQTVFITDVQAIQGYWVLALGAAGFIIFQFAWYANILSLLAVMLSRSKPQLAFLLSVISVLVASEAFLFDEIPLDKSVEITDYGRGFYVWYACHYLIVYGTLLRLVAWGNSRAADESRKASKENSDNRAKAFEGEHENKQENNQIPVIKHPLPRAKEKKTEKRIPVFQEKNHLNETDMETGITVDKATTRKPPPLPVSSSGPAPIKKTRANNKSVPPPLPSSSRVEQNVDNRESPLRVPPQFDKSRS
jgi:hypothetical protein